ncbi:MAG: sulfatase-like hydrolase/transferase [Planctomycetaceae bacterium]|nr:sulfatase-like hydrolase/transferase [Planctomycetaceae bacterium]
MIRFSLCFLVAALFSIGEGRAEQPNILFLFADDLCFQQLHALGHDPQVQTPNLDRLAARGAIFERCYNMGSYSGAVCVASRTMLNSGRSLWRARAIYDTSEQERQAGRWWSEYLKKAGYHTCLTGKWHCKASAEKSFDVTAHVRPGMPKDTPAAYDRPHAGQPDQWSPTDQSQGGYWEGGRHWSEVGGDDAVSFLEAANDLEQPFFHYVAFNAPHDPRQSPQEFLDLYPADGMVVPVNYQAEYPFKDAIGCGPGLRDERLAPFPRTEYAVQVHRREYYALITHLDVQIGRVLDALDKLQSSRETWIFFSADHGLAVGQHGLLGKQNLYDHSVRVPFLVIGPGVEPGRRITTPIYLQDVMPTTLELAGVERPDHVEFQSLLPILAGARESLHNPIYGAYLNWQRSVTQDGWKLILYPQAPVARLYHVADDPRELVDLAADPAQKERKKSLFAALVALQEKFDDPLDLTQTFSDLQ